MMHEERIRLYDDFHAGVRMMMDKIEKMAREKASWSLSEMGYLADIMKDLAKTEKCIAIAHEHYSEHSEELY